MSSTSISVEIKNKWSYSPAIPYMPSWCGQVPLWRPRRRWEDNIKMDLQEVGVGGVGGDWIELAQDTTTAGPSGRAV